MDNLNDMVVNIHTNCELREVYRWKNTLQEALLRQAVCSWVIWSTSVTVESEGSFLSVFVFFENQ